ncbi:MAG: NADH-quinone oxidoreductase subunit C [Clostridia bacterium]|nr:NADH-quinone oxidoreductase subunit C [Clostridia bacterium]
MDNSIMISKNDLLENANRLHDEKYRLVQICATRVADKLVLDYSFGRDYEFVNLKCEIDPDEEIMSISRVYAPAFLYENEMHDLHGVKILHMTTDYEGSFYRTAIKSPFSPIKED